MFKFYSQLSIIAIYRFANIILPIYLKSQQCVCWLVTVANTFEISKLQLLSTSNPVELCLPTGKYDLTLFFCTYCTNRSNLGPYLNYSIFIPEHLRKKLYIGIMKHSITQECL